MVAGRRLETRTRSVLRPLDPVASENLRSSADDYQPENALQLIQTGAVDTVQVIYNVFDQQPEERLLPACPEHGVGVVVPVALDAGGLTGRITANSTFPDGDFRNGYFRGDCAAQVEQRVAALTRDLEIDTDQIADTALRYVLGSPAVSTVIASMRSVRNVERNCATSDGRRLTSAQHDIIATHRWERNFYQGS
jgi:aryl-alcohol dehydrogenase-like predicted oxidoreductase